MRVEQARRAAAEWVSAYAARTPGFRGAFFSGSVTEQPGQAVLPATSDVDLTVLLAVAEAPPKLGKLTSEGVLLEVTELPEAELGDVERVARTFYLAPSFRTDQIIADPTGRLHQVLARVAPRFDEPDEIRQRYRSVLDRLDDVLAGFSGSRGTVGLDRADPTDALPPTVEQVISWLFGASLPTLVVLVAARRNPTVRLRYLRARETLAAYGLSALYPGLLELLGCEGTSAEQVRRHLDRLSVTFDAAVPVARTHFPFSADITAQGRPVAVGGTEELLASGDHREAVFWLLATFCRCRQILRVDAPAVAARLAPDFDAAVSELLGLRSGADLRGRADRVAAMLPSVLAAAEAIIDHDQAGYQPGPPATGPAATSR